MKVTKLEAIIPWLFVSQAFAEIETEIPIGIEAVTGFRSSYIHRGYELASASLDFQLEAELVLSDNSSLHFGLSHLAESNGQFSESTIYSEYIRSITKDFRVGTSLTYRTRSNSQLNGGLDLGIFASYDLNDDWRWRTEINYDFGESAAYFATEVEWSKPISKDAFIAAKSGFSLTSGYPNPSGFNDFYSRFSLTYALSDQVSFTPFFGSTTSLNNEGSNKAFAGIWFEVIF